MENFYSKYVIVAYLKYVLLIYSPLIFSRFIKDKHSIFVI